MLFQPFHHGTAAVRHSIVEADDNFVSGLLSLLAVSARREGNARQSRVTDCGQA
jgi:hypothetical protein